MPFYRSNPKGSGGSVDYSSFYVRLNNQDDYLITSNFAKTVFAEDNAYFNLNVPIIVGDNIADTTGMLSGCRNFNQPVTLGMRIRHADRMFETCYKFNQSITFPPVVETLYNVFWGCNALNSPVDLSLITSLKNCGNLFGNCKNYNYPINIQTNQYLNMYALCSGCDNFNSPVTISAQGFHGGFMFSNCFNLNQPVIINAVLAGNNNVLYMFQNCSSFNQPIEIKYNSYAAYGNIYANYIFGNCISFNSILTFNEVYKNDTDTGSLRIWMDNLFYHCTNYNQPFNIPNRAYSANTLFGGCTNFNQKVNLPNNLIYARYMYSNTAFNQPYEINCPTVMDIDGMFSHCNNLNSTITFNVPNVNSLAYLLQNTAFNKDIYIPSQINNLYHTFTNCKSFSKNVYVQGNTYKVINVAGMFLNCDNNKRKNIFFNKVFDTRFNQSTSTSVIGASITWENISGNVGFYNDTYNIYCYNNYSG